MSSRDSINVSLLLFMYIYIFPELTIAILLPQVSEKLKIIRIPENLLLNLLFRLEHSSNFCLLYKSPPLTPTREIFFYAQESFQFRSIHANKHNPTDLKNKCRIKPVDLCCSLAFFQRILRGVLLTVE